MENGITRMGRTTYRGVWSQYFATGDCRPNLGWSSLSRKGHASARLCESGLSRSERDRVTWSDAALQNPTLANLRTHLAVPAVLVLNLVVFRYESFCAGSHRYGSPGDRVGLVEVCYGLLESLARRGRLDLGQRLQSKLLYLDRRGLDVVVSNQGWRNVPHSVSQVENIVVRKRRSEDLGKRSQNLPVLPGGTRWGDGCPTHLASSFSVDPGDRLFGVSTPGQTNIGVLSTDVSVVSLVDDKGVLRDRLGVKLVGVEEVDEFGSDLGGRGGGGETDVVGSGSRGGLKRGKRSISQG
jgi:hypothetical protein